MHLPAVERRTDGEQEEQQVHAYYMQRSSSSLFLCLQGQATKLRAHQPHRVCILPCTCCAFSFKHMQFSPLRRKVYDMLGVSRSALRCDSGTALRSARRCGSGTALLHYFCGSPGGGKGGATANPASKNDPTSPQMAHHHDGGTGLPHCISGSPGGGVGTGMGNAVAK
jgi:hypothetical protein